MADAYSYLVAVFLAATIAVNFIINVVVLVMMRKRRLYVIVANRLFLQFVLIDFIACFFVFVPASVTSILQSWAFSDTACHIHGVITTFVYIVIFGLLIVRCVERITKIKNRSLHKAVFCSNCRLMVVSSVVWVVGVFVAVIPVSGWVSFKYDYYHSGCIVQLEESILYIFLLFTLGVTLTAVFVVIAFMIVSKADKNIDDVERINGGKGWHMGNGSKPEENKNPNMATASANLIISTVSVIFFFPYFAVMFSRAAGGDVWRGAYSICLIPVVLTFTLRPLIYLFRLKMAIKAKERNTPRAPSDKKRILAVSRRGKRDRPPGKQTGKGNNHTEPTYSSDEWSEYDDDKSKTSCFPRKAKKYDEKDSPNPPPYEYKTSHPKPSPLLPIKGNDSKKQPNDPVFKKPNQNNPKESEVDEGDMSEFYLDGNSSENDAKKKQKNRPGLSKNKEHLSPKIKTKDQNEKNSTGVKKDKPRAKTLPDVDASNSDSEKPRNKNDPESFLSPRMIHIQENPKKKKQLPKKSKSKSDEENISSEMSENGIYRKKKHRKNKRRSFKEDDDESSSCYSYSDDENQPKGRQKTKIIVIKQGLQKNPTQSKGNNKIAPKKIDDPIDQEKLRKQNKLNPFFRPGMIKNKDEKNKNDDKKTNKFKQGQGASSDEFEKNCTDESNDKAVNNEGSRKKKRRKRPKQYSSPETEFSDEYTDSDDAKRRRHRRGYNQRKKAPRNGDNEDSSNSDNYRMRKLPKKKYDQTEDETDDDNKQRGRYKKNRENPGDGSKTDTEDETTKYKNKNAISKADLKNTKPGYKKEPYPTHDSRSPTIQKHRENAAKYNPGDHETQGKKNENSLDNLDNDKLYGLDKGIMEEMLNKNMDNKICPVINNNYYIIDPTRIGNPGDVYGNSNQNVDSNDNNSEKSPPKNIPGEARWKNSDADTNPKSDSKSSETKQSQPRFFNNAPVNVDNLPESKPKARMNEDPTEIYENLGPGDTLKPYKKRRLVPENSDKIPKENVQDNHWNPLETMGPGNPLLPHNQDKYDDPNDGYPNDIGVNSTNSKTNANPIDAIGPGETMEPYEDGNYDSKNQRRLQQNNISPDDRFDDQNSQSLQNNENRTPDLTRILGPGDPIIPHDDEDDDLAHDNTNYENNGKLNKRLRPNDYNVTNPVQMNLDPRKAQTNPYMDYPNESKRNNHPNFANPYDGNALQMNPYQKNPNIGFEQEQNDRMGQSRINEIPYPQNNYPQGYTSDVNYPYVSGESIIGRVPQNTNTYAKYPNQQHHPGKDNPPVRFKDHSHKQNHPYQRDNPYNSSYPYTENAGDGKHFDGSIKDRTRNVDVNNPRRFDPYNMDQNEKRENHDQIEPSSRNPLDHRATHANKPSSDYSNSFEYPNTAHEKKNNPSESGNNQSNTKGDKTGTMGHEPNPRKSENVNQQSNPIGLGNGNKKQPSIPRSNMNSMIKPKPFGNDFHKNEPIHADPGEEKPSQFQYVTPQGIDDNFPVSMNLPNGSAINPRLSEKLNRQSNPIDPGYANKNGNGKPKQPSIPRSNMNSMKNPKHFGDYHNKNDPNHTGLGEENHPQFKYVTPQNADDTFPTSMALPNGNATDPSNEDLNGQRNANNNPNANSNTLNTGDTSAGSKPTQMLPLGYQPSGNTYPGLHSDSNLDPYNKFPNSASLNNANVIPNNVQPQSDWDTPLPITNPTDQKFLPKEIGPPVSYSSASQKPKGRRVVNQNVLVPKDSTQTSDNKKPSEEHPYEKKQNQKLGNENPSNGEPGYVPHQMNYDQDSNENFYPESHDPKHRNIKDDVNRTPTDPNHIMPQNVHINDPIGPPKSYSSIRQKPKEGRAVQISQPTTRHNQLPTDNKNMGSKTPHDERIPVNSARNPNPNGQPNYPENWNDKNNPNQQRQNPKNSEPGKKKLENISNPQQYHNPNGSYDQNQSGIPDYPHDGRNNPFYKTPLERVNTNPLNGDNDPYRGQLHPGKSAQNEYLNGSNLPDKQQNPFNHQGRYPNDNVKFPNQQEHQNRSQHAAYPHNSNSIPNSVRNRKPNDSDLQASRSNPRLEGGTYHNDIEDNRGYPVNNGQDKVNRNSENSRGHGQNNAPDRYQNNKEPNTKQPMGSSAPSARTTESMPNRNEHTNQPQSEGETNPKSNKRVSFDPNTGGHKNGKTLGKDKIPISSTNNSKAKKDMWGTADKKMSAYYHLTRVDKWDMVHGYDNKYDKSGKVKKGKDGGWKKEHKDIDLL